MKSDEIDDENEEEKINSKVSKFTKISLVKKEVIVNV